MVKLYTKYLKRIFYKLSFWLVVILSSNQIKAQLNPLAGIYFENAYLANPAMAGFEKGMNFSIIYRQPWSAIEGAPKTQSLTAELGTSKKVGLGLAIYNDEAGLIKQTRVMATYSYQLPFNDYGKKLRLGISLGFMDDRVMNEQVIGDEGDASISKFNQRETYIDGDFGAAYTTDKLNVQFAIPNIKSVLQKDQFNSTADFATFFSAVSYKLYFPTAVDGLGLEPKVALRGIHGFDNILDLGAKITVANNAASVIAVYHSSQSATIGMGAIIKNLGSVNGSYTTSTAALSPYTRGNFELNFKIRLDKAKKIITK